MNTLADGARLRLVLTMDIYQKLTVLTFFTSAVTLVLVAVAVVPHIKHGMTVIRDACLWATFVLVGAVAVWLALQRLPLADMVSPTRTKTDSGASQTQSVLRPSKHLAEADPYYLAPSAD